MPRIPRPHIPAPTPTPHPHPRPIGETVNPLPNPKTPHDRYLNDIAQNTREILAHLRGDQPEEDGTVELQEPATPAATPAETPGGDVDLDSLKRDELDEYAKRVGVSEPDKLPNKDAVKAAIAEAN